MTASYSCVFKRDVLLDQVMNKLGRIDPIGYVRHRIARPGLARGRAQHITQIVPGLAVTVQQIHDTEACRGAHIGITGAEPGNIAG